MNAIVWDKWLKRPANMAGGVVRSAIGLEVAQHSLNMVQLEQNPQGELRLYDWVSIPFDEPREQLIYQPRVFKQLYRQVKQHAGFKGRAVNAMMPGSELRIMSVNYECPPGQDPAMAIARIIAERVEGSLAEYVIDYLPVRQSEKHGKGLAVVAIAEQQKVQAYLDSLHGVGLQVQALDIGPAAIKRLVTAIAGTKISETVLVVNFGDVRSYLSIISGRRLLFDEDLHFGEQQMVAEVSRALDMPEDVARNQIRSVGLGSFEAGHLDDSEKEIADTVLQILRPSFRQLGDSLKRALVYAVAETRGEPISQIYIVGSIARWRGAANVLTALMDIPVSVLPDPITAFADRQLHADDDLQVRERPELALATGLALRGLKLHG